MLLAAAARRKARTKNKKVEIKCICSTTMKAGLIQQGSPKCGQCTSLLVNSYCYYCPTTGNSHLHPNGYFLCEKCANSKTNNNNNTRRRPQSLPAKNHMNHSKNNMPNILKQGYMQKKGEYNTSFRKRWFRLYSNRRMSYSESPSSKMCKGYCDFLMVSSMTKKGQKGFQVRTPKRTWIYLCSSTAHRDEWFALIQLTCYRKNTNTAAQSQAQASQLQKLKQQRSQSQLMQSQRMSSKNLLYPSSQSQQVKSQPTQLDLSQYQSQSQNQSPRQNQSQYYAQPQSPPQPQPASAYNPGAYNSNSNSNNVSNRYSYNPGVANNNGNNSNSAYNNGSMYSNVNANGNNNNNNSGVPAAYSSVSGYNPAYVPQAQPGSTQV